GTSALLCWIVRGPTPRSADLEPPAYRVRHIVDLTLQVPDVGSVQTGDLHHGTPVLVAASTHPDTAAPNVERPEQAGHCDHRGGQGGLLASVTADLQVHPPYVPIEGDRPGPVGQLDGLPSDRGARNRPFARRCCPDDGTFRWWPPRGRARRRGSA